MVETKPSLGWINILNERVGYVLSFLIIPMTLIAVIEVILRYLFNRPTIWAWDINMMLLGAFSILSGGYVLFKGGHVTMDVVILRLPPRVRAVIGLITSLVFFFSMGILVWQSGVEARDSFLIKEKLNTVWSPAIYPLKMLWPIGAFLLFLQGIVIFVRDLNTARSKEVSK